jgi:hypothetical protein
MLLKCVLYCCFAYVIGVDVSLLQIKVKRKVVPVL